MATTSFYALFESASGYGLFSILETEEIGAFLEEVRYNDELAFADMRRNLLALLLQKLNSSSVSTSQAQTGITDLARFQRVVKMTAFHPFETAENALENINAITEHEMTEDLRTFLESNLAKGKKASKYPLGVVSDVIKCKPMR